MNVVVTGASGFVGRHVVAELERRGVSPTLVRRPGSRMPDHWSHHRIVEMDIATDTPDAHQRLGLPLALIHLAWGGLPNYSSPHHLDRELPAHAGFLMGLIAAGLPSLTVAGSCLEYGMQTGALREDLPTVPVTAYGVAKDELRKGLERLRAITPFNLTWARLFYLHGTGQGAGSLLPQLERAMQRGDTAFDMSGGEQLRDYMPVEEAAREIVLLTLSGMDNGIVNICSGRPISVRHLVETEVERRGSSIRLNLGRLPYPDYEPMAFWGDRQKLASRLESIDDPF